MHGFVKAAYCVATTGDILRATAPPSWAAPLAGKTAVVSSVTGVTPGQDAGVMSVIGNGGPSFVRAGGAGVPVRYPAVPARDEESTHARFIVVTLDAFPRHGPYP